MKQAERDPSTGTFPKYLQQPGLGKAEARSWEPRTQCFPFAWNMAQIHHLLTPRINCSRKLDLKQRDLNQAQPAVV